MLLWWWRGYNEPDWRTRLLRPFLQVAKDPTLITLDVEGVLESWEYKWVAKEEVGWEKVGVHPLHDQPGRRATLVRRRLK